MAGWLNKSKAGGNYLRILFTEIKPVDLNQDAHQAKLHMGTGTSQGSVDSIMIDELPF
jgi:hypothetical protein